MTWSDEHVKILTKYNKANKRKIIGGKYIVAAHASQFDRRSISVEHPAKAIFKIADIPTVFNDKLEDPKRSAEALFLYLDTPSKCKKFLNGELVKVHIDNTLRPEKGRNKKFGLPEPTPGDIIRGW